MYLLDLLKNGEKTQTIIKLLGFSKGFDCIPHDLVIAKLAVYEFDKNMVAMLYLFTLKKQKTECRV